MSDSPESPKPKFNFKPTSFERVNPPTAEPASAPTDVYAILEQNRAKALQSERPLDLTRQPSRRRKDYWRLMVGGNGLIILTLAWLPKNPLTFAFGLSGLVLFSLGLTWVVFGVMDDY